MELSERPRAQTQLELSNWAFQSWSSVPIPLDSVANTSNSFFCWTRSRRHGAVLFHPLSSAEWTAVFAADLIAGNQRPGAGGDRRCEGPKPSLKRIRREPGLHGLLMGGRNLSEPGFSSPYFRFFGVFGAVPRVPVVPLGGVESSFPDACPFDGAASGGPSSLVSRQSS